MLLLDATMSIAAEKEEALNDWYHLHVPRLISVPGYQSGYRYVAITPGPRYVAFYEIRDRSSLPVLLGDDLDRRDPLTVSEWQTWDEELVPYTRDMHIHVYEPTQGASVRILHAAPAFVAIRLRGQLIDRAGLDDAWQNIALPVLIDDEDVIEATLMRQSADPVVQWLNAGEDCVLAVIECRAAAAASSLSVGYGQQVAASLAAAAGGAAPHVAAYRMIAYHTVWPRLSGDAADAVPSE